MTVDAVYHLGRNRLMTTALTVVSNVVATMNLRHATSDLKRNNII